MAGITEGRLRNRRTNERSGTLSAVEFVTHPCVRVVRAGLAGERRRARLSLSSPRTVVAGRADVALVDVGVASLVAECSDGAGVLVRVRLTSCAPEASDARLRIERSLKKTRKLSFY